MRPILPSILAPPAQPPATSIHAANANIQMSRRAEVVCIAAILEQRTDRKLKDALPFPRVRIEIDAVRRAERPKRRNPAPFETRGLPQCAEGDGFIVVKP